MNRVAKAFHKGGAMCDYNTVKIHNIFRVQTYESKDISQHNTILKISNNIKKHFKNMTGIVNFRFTECGKHWPDLNEQSQVTKVTLPYHHIIVFLYNKKRFNFILFLQTVEASKTVSLQINLIWLIIVTEHLDSYLSI